MRLLFAGQRPGLPMPELPDITIYLDALKRRIAGERLLGVRVNSPFLVRTFEPALEAAVDKRVLELRRLGKRIAIGLDDEVWIVLHLMIAGRLHWKAPGARLAGKYQLAALDFGRGTLVLTEAGAKRRAALYVVRGAEALAQHDPGGIDIFAATAEQFAAVLRGENHTLKRALSDPHLIDGIGNAYSDEILHRAGLSPLAMTGKLTTAECQRLHSASCQVLGEWVERLRAQTGDRFPENVTAFRDGLAVHGRFGKPCPACGSPVQRIRYADREVNYCPGCQTSGRILADRSLSRLLKDDWPRHLSTNFDRGADLAKAARAEKKPPTVKVHSSWAATCPSRPGLLRSINGSALQRIFHGGNPLNRSFFLACYHPPIGECGALEGNGPSAPSRTTGLARHAERR